MTNSLNNEDEKQIFSQQFSGNFTYEKCKNLGVF
jgi:hypothetical protein